MVAMSQKASASTVAPASHEAAVEKYQLTEDNLQVHFTMIFFFHLLSALQLVTSRKIHTRIDPHYKCVDISLQSYQHFRFLKSAPLSKFSLYASHLDDIKEVLGSIDWNILNDTNNNRTW